MDERDLQLLRGLFQEQRQGIMEDVRAMMDTKLQEQRQGIMEDVRDMIDVRFQEQDARIEERFREQDARIEEKFQEQTKRLEERMDEKLQEQRQDIMHDVRILMESYFNPKFNLLADEIQVIREILIPKERIERVEADIQVLKAAFRTLSEDVQRLKQAQ